MNDNKVPGIWKWTVILLLACNVGLVLTIWLKPNWKHGGPGIGHPERPREFVIHSLKFTDEQVVKYDELIRVHRSAMDRLREQSMEYRRLLFNNLAHEQSGLNADSVAQLIANNQKEIETVTYTHFRQVRAICTDAQKVMFDKTITDVIRKMNGGMHGGPPPGERDARQGPPPGEQDGHRPPPPDGEGPPQEQQ